MKLSAEELRSLKGKQRIPMLTAYTAPIARYLESAGIPVILVGDSVGMVEMGFSSTREVTIDHLCYHVGAVRRGAPHTHIVGDLPYGSEQSVDVAVHNARRLVESGADSVKFEGYHEAILSALIGIGIPLIGHTGLTPQTAQSFSQVGRTSEEAERIRKEAALIASSGAALLVLEHIPNSLAQQITEEISIPTIGIGAGPDCDGQVLVINDAIGIGEKWPPFSRQFAYVGREIEAAATTFVRQVMDKTFK